MRRKANGCYHLKCNKFIELLENYAIYQKKQHQVSVEDLWLWNKMENLKLLASINVQFQTWVKL